MNIKKTSIFDASEPLSKALESVSETNMAAVITRNNAYFGIIDDRNVRTGITNPDRTRCESVCVKAPVLGAEASLKEKLDTFLSGHYRAIPVIDAKGKPLGVYARADFIAELLEMKVVPKDRVHSLMNSPVFTIQHNETLAGAKRVMKEKDANRLVVMRNGRPVGVLSTYDLMANVVPQGRRGLTLVPEVTKPDAMQVLNFMREDIGAIREDALVWDAMRKMANENRSSLLAVDENGSPKGVISAVDVFRKVLELFSDEPAITVSGLGKDELKYYDDVKKAVLHTVDKFKKSFAIDDLRIHFKKGKSVYDVQAHMELDNKPLSVNVEEYTFAGALDKLTLELHNLLGKRKGKGLDKKTHGRTRKSIDR